MAATAAARRALGRHGERLAEQFLLARGMHLLERNWRCDEGEIDLVLRDGNVLVACEVKTRSGDTGGTPHEAVTQAKAERVARLAMRWADEREVVPQGIRVDVVAIRVGRGAAQVEHVAGIL